MTTLEMQLEEKTARWKALPRNNQDELAVADNYFDTELMPLSQKKFLQKENERSLPQHYGMVLTLGTSWQPLALSISALRPEHILILCTKETLVQIESLVAFLQLAADSYEYVFVDRSEPKDIYQAMEAKVEPWRGKPCCVDITGGTKAMASSAAMMAVKLKWDVYYVESKYLPLYRRPEPGSEYLKQIDQP